MTTVARSAGPSPPTHRNTIAGEARAAAVADVFASSVASDAEFDSQPEPVWIEDGKVRFAIQVHHRIWGEGVQSLIVSIPVGAARAGGDLVFEEVCGKLVLDPPDCGVLADAIAKTVVLHKGG